MIYELFLEGQLADIRQDLGMQLSYNIDDVNKYGSRDTSFSKTIVLPGTAKNNKLLGFVGELGSNNPYLPGNENIGVNFNVAQTTKAELRANGLLLLKGVFRLTGIVKERDMIEYEGNLFGELGGFIAAIGAGKLEDLNFSEYNHTYTRNNIVNSWDTINGSGYYYPLIDYGTYSTPEKNPGRVKRDYDYRTFRPALFVKEYIDKMFLPTGYTYESSFFDSAFFKKLIVPNNFKELKGFFTDLLDVKTALNLTISSSIITETLQFNTENLKRSFTGNGNPDYTYTGSNESLNLNYKLIGVFGIFSSQAFFKFSIIKNTTVIKTYSYFNRDLIKQINIIDNINLDVATNDKLIFEIQYQYLNGGRIDFQYLKIKANNPISTDVQLGNNILIKDIIPQNILQKDFFVWIMKMFNLYITEDKVKEKHLLIEPYTEYWNLDQPKDWTYKVARDKAWNIKPMGMLNGRFFEYKYKEDNDFYNEGYKKKYNLPYGSRLEDTSFQFAKDKQTIDIGFSPTVLIEYEGRDKVVSAIYKKSSGNAVDQEERMDSNIRILMAKKMTGVESWYIRNNDISGSGGNLGDALTTYGYAGHFDDPVNPTKDINFGASQEIYFEPNVYPTNNLFNDYWSGYIAEIADKDSKLLTCHVYLTDLDIAQLDFSKPVFIDGVLWRINKVMDYDATSGELTKVELLKVIDTGFGITCAKDWTKANYAGTTFRNGDSIPQVTDTTTWAALTTPAWCHYNNDPANDAIYGKLYNWYAVNDPRGFAPFGYRVPTDQDWTDLTDCLGGAIVAGGKMKSTNNWTSPNIGATNESFFAGLPGGYRGLTGSFVSIGFEGFFWSSTQQSIDNAWSLILNYASNSSSRFDFKKTFGFSVRLIKEN